LVNKIIGCIRNKAEVTRRRLYTLTRKLLQQRCETFVWW